MKVAKNSAGLVIPQPETGSQDSNGSGSLAISKHRHDARNAIACVHPGKMPCFGTLNPKDSTILTSLVTPGTAASSKVQHDGSMCFSYSLPVEVRRFDQPWAVSALVLVGLTFLQTVSFHLVSQKLDRTCCLPPSTAALFSLSSKLHSRKCTYSIQTQTRIPARHFTFCVSFVIFKQNPFSKFIALFTDFEIPIELLLAHLTNRNAG